MRRIVMHNVIMIKESGLELNTGMITLWLLMPCTNAALQYPVVFLEKGRSVSPVS